MAQNFLDKSGLAYFWGKVKSYISTAISGKIDTAGSGLSKSGTTLNHSNSITSRTTASVCSIKFDSQGHITAATAVTIPTPTYATWPAVRNVESVSYADAFSNITDSGINVLAGDNVEMTTVSTWNTVYINAASGFPLSSVSTGTTKYLREDGTWAVPSTSGGGTYTAGTGLSLSGTTFNHSNSITSRTTASICSIKFDSQGHITSATGVTLSDYFSRTTISKVYTTTISAGSTAAITMSLSNKTGYYPIGVVGYSTTRTLANVYRVQITNAVSGSVTVTMNVHNMHTAAWTSISTYCDVLWVKV